MHKLRTMAVLAVLVVMGLAAAPSYAFDEVFQKTYPLPAGGTFQLHNVNGPVTVSGWERDQVEIYAKKSTRRDPRDLTRVTIEVDAKPGAVAVQTRYPQDEGVEVYVEYHIRVPQRIRLSHIGTVNGGLHIFGVDGAGELRTVNGDIEVLDTAGHLTARTTNGSIRAELRRLDVTGPTAFETVNGSVQIEMPPNTSATLELTSLNGDFRSDLPVRMESSGGSREFRGRLGDGGGVLRIRTVNGSIRVLGSRPII